MTYVRPASVSGAPSMRSFLTISTPTNHMVVVP